MSYDPLFRSGATLSINILKQHFGIKCDIYYPETATKVSVYTNTSQEYDWVDTPSREQVPLLVPNVAAKRYLSGLEVDAHGQEDDIVIYQPIEDEVIPNDSKLVYVNEEGEELSFRVEHSKVYRGLSLPLYREVTLIPLV